MLPAIIPRAIPARCRATQNAGLMHFRRKTILQLPRLRGHWTIWGQSVDQAEATSDEVDEEGNPVQVVVYLLKMPGGDASAKSAAVGKLQEYALDGSSAAIAAGGWCLWPRKGTPGDYDTAYVCSPWPSVSGRV